MFDTHIHTKNSHDSTQTIDEICLSAIKKGVKGIAITDHTDSYAYDKERNFKAIEGSVKDTEYAQKAYGDRLKIFKGIEIGQYHFDTKTSEMYCSYTDFDVILGSVHSFPFEDKTVRFSRDDLSKVDWQVLIEQVDRYYEEVLETAKTSDVDVLCHLTYPFRYIMGKYRLGEDICMYRDIITEILEAIIKRDIALEINTANFGTNYPYASPPFYIVKEYYDLGGRLITLGSDAHSPERIANSFDYVIKRLKEEIGIKEYYYYEKRKPIAVKI